MCVQKWNRRLAARGFTFLSSSVSWSLTHQVHLQNYCAQLKTKAAFEVFLPLSLKGEIIETGNNLMQAASTYRSEVLSFYAEKNKMTSEKIS